MIRYNKNEIKENLTIDQIFTLVSDLGGEPSMGQDNSFFIAKTICHNVLGEGSHKLYYYDNTKLFRCYTDCGDSFDIYELICRLKKIRKEQKSYYSKDGDLLLRDWELFDAIEYIINYFNIYIEESGESSMDAENSEDWKILNRNEKLQEYELNNQIVDLKIYDSKILNRLPHPHIEPWEKENINYNIMVRRGIAYNPVSQGIIIPHYNIDNKLIGIRERTLIKEEEVYGKYKPSIINNIMYNHPLGFNLYNLNNSKKTISIIKKAIIFEGEKSPLIYASYFGEENDISVACCGSSLTTYQIELLISLGVEEIIIAFDKQFKEIGDEEYHRWIKKLEGFHKKYSQYVQMSFLFDKFNLLNYKDSPIDCGIDNFNFLFENRIFLEEKGK